MKIHCTCNILVLNISFIYCSELVANLNEFGIFHEDSHDQRKKMPIENTILSFRSLGGIIQLHSQSIRVRFTHA